MRHLLPVIAALAALGVSACAGGKSASPANITVVENPVPASLTPAQKQVVERDVRPSIRNALTGGLDLDVAKAEFPEIIAVQAQGRLLVCGTAVATDLQLDIRRKMNFSGELVNDVLFVRDYIGGDRTQNAFVADVCAKRGIKLGG